MTVDMTTPEGWKYLIHLNGEPLWDCVFASEEESRVIRLRTEEPINKDPSQKPYGRVTYVLDPVTGKPEEYEQFGHVEIWKRD